MQISHSKVNQMQKCLKYCSLMHSSYIEKVQRDTKEEIII